MAKISAKKSNLKTIANKIIVSPNTDAVADLKFKRRKDFSTFVKWIDSSNKALDRIKLPSKKEVEKLGKGSGGSNWLPALLALLGLGALAAKGQDKDKGDSDIVTAEDTDTGAKVPKLLQGSNITGILDLTRQLNDKNIRKNNKINRNNKKIDLKNKRTLKNNLKNAKIKSNWIKNLKSDTLKNKFWKRGGTPPQVTSLGERWKRVQLKHGSKWMKVGQGTKFGATKAQAPLVPDPLSKNMLKKQPLSRTSFVKNIKGLFKPGNLKNLGKGFIAGWIGDQVEGVIINEIDKGFFHLTKRQIDKNIKKYGVLKVYQRNVDLYTELVNKKKEGFWTDWGVNEANEKMRKSFSESINYIKINYKKELQEAGVEVGPVYRTKGVDYSSNTLQSGKEVATIPFPIITTDMSEKFNLPTINTDVFAKSSSSESSIPFGLNSDDNPFSDLLLTNLK